MFPIIWKPVNWFAEQIKWLISVWWGILVVNGLSQCSLSTYHVKVSKNLWFCNAIVVYRNGTLVQNGLQRVKKSIVLIYSQKHFVALTPKVVLEWWKNVDELLRYVESKEVFVRQFMEKFMPENLLEIWQYMLFNLV